MANGSIVIAAKSIFLLCVEPDWIFVLFWRPKMAKLESCANSHLCDMSTFVAEGRIFPVSWTPLLSYFFTGKNMSESPTLAVICRLSVHTYSWLRVYTTLTLAEFQLFLSIVVLLTSAHRCSVQTAVKSRLSHAKECEVNF